MLSAVLFLAGPRSRYLVACVILAGQSRETSDLGRCDRCAALPQIQCSDKTDRGGAVDFRLFHPSFSDPA